MNNIKNVLDKSVEEAQKGAQSAKETIEIIGYDIEKLEKDTQNIIDGIRKNNIKADEAMSNLIKQLKYYVSGYTNSKSVFEKEILQKVKRIKEFNVCIFGRTMAGKSTLMEIIKNGDGSSIGNGTQRTTRDVREYHWNGINIIDVPGVCVKHLETDAVKDEEIAFSAAKDSDMIIYLFNDDSFQQSDAKWLSKVKALGRPILGVMNVKKYIDEDELEYVLQEIEEGFDDERIDELTKQIVDFSNISGQDWQNIKVVPTHLKSAFDARTNKNLDESRQLMEASRFKNVESALFELIANNGLFYRQKAFNDLTANFLLEIGESILESIYLNIDTQNIFKGANNEICDFKKAFKANAKRRIEEFIENVGRILRIQASSFAYANYNSDDLDVKWERIVRKYKHEEEAAAIINELYSEIQDRMYSIQKMIRQNLKTIKPVLRKQNIGEIDYTDYSTAYNYGIGAMGIGFTVACFAFRLTPIGLIVGSILSAVGLKFVDDWARKKLEEKLQQARQQLQSELNVNINNYLCELKKQMIDYVNVLVRECIDPLNETLRDLNQCLLKSKISQDGLLKQVQEEINKTNKQVLIKAFELLEEKKCCNQIIKGSVRIPGDTTVLLLEPSVYDKNLICDDIVIKLEKILQERVIRVRSSYDANKIIRDLFENVNIKWNYEDVTQTYIVKCDVANKENIKRQRMLQQILLRRVRLEN